MSQYTHLGLDIYPQGSIPKSALISRKKINWLQRKVRELQHKIFKFRQRHPIFSKYYDIVTVSLIILGMAGNILISCYLLYISAVMSFQLQSQLGFQSMVITLLTLFTYVLITGIINTCGAAYKLRNYTWMSYSEVSAILSAIHWRGALFWLYSLFCGLLLISIPTLLASEDFSIQPDSVKIARFVMLFLMLLIEKFLETRITAKLD